MQNHSTAFKKLKTDLAEAKHERIFDNRIRGNRLKLYDAAIGSLARLAQHLNGLRSSTKLQDKIIRAVREGKLRSAGRDDLGVRSMSLTGGLEGMSSDSEQEEMADAVRLLTKFRELAGTQMDDLIVSHSDIKGSYLLNSQSRCDDTLQAVQAFSLTDGDQVDISRLRNGLSTALREFNQSATRAIKRLYAGPRREKEFLSSHDTGHERSPELETDEDQVEGPNETVFLVYL